MCESKRNISAWSIKNAQVLHELKKKIDYFNSFDPNMDDCDHLQIKRKKILMRSQSVWHGVCDLRTCLTILIQR